MIDQESKPVRPFSLIAGSIVLIGLYLASRYSYPLFHSLVEIFSVIVACGIFIIAWNSRHIMNNNYFLLLGIASLFVGGVDLLHALAYKGMGVFPENSTNLATQLWIVGRYLQSFALFTAPIFLGKKLRGDLAIALFLGAASLLLAAVFGGVFPDCFVEGGGLTPFKKGSEYVVSFMLLSSLFFMRRKREFFEQQVMRLMSCAIALFIASELAFTIYTDVYGISNMVGHLFKLAGFFLIYKALIETGLVRPYDLVFREIKESEGKYRALFENMIDGFALHRIVVDESGKPTDYVFLEVNSAFESFTGLKAEDIQNKPVTHVLPGIEEDSANWIGVYGNVALTGKEQRFERYSETLDKWYAVMVYSPMRNHFATVFEDITGRKQADEALQESESRFRTMANAMPQLAWMARADGHIFWYNQRWYDYTGTVHEQMEGWGWQSVHDQGELPKVLERWQAAIAKGEPFDMTFPLRGADGEFRTFLTRGIPLKNAAGQVLEWFGTNTDVSELKRVEHALRESEERHRVLAETMLQGVVHQDANGTIISMNPAAERILGKNREDFLGNSSVSVEHDTIRENGEIFPGREHPTMEALRTGLPVSGVVMGVLNPKRDEYRWVSIDAVPVFRSGENLPSEVYSVFEDITERKKAEMTLQASEQRIQQALHVSRSFTFDWLPVTDQVTRSSSCGAILHLTGDEAVNDTGDQFFQKIHPEDRVRFGQTLHELTPAANSYTTEYRYVCKDGVEIVLEETGQASFDSTGTILRLVGVTTDITARKQAEQALQKVHDELEQRVHDRTEDLAITIEQLQSEIGERNRAEVSLLNETTARLSALEALREKEQMLIQQSRQAGMGEMIGNIAHQWRQPLNALGLYTQRVGAFYGLPGFNKEFLDDSVARSMEIIQHMSKTIDDFSNYFKPEKEKADFHVTEAIRSTLSLLKGSFQNPVISVTVVENDHPVINGFQNEFSQVFLNILNNARDAIIERGIVDARIIVTIYREDDCTVVTIADNAGGIPEEIINKVFEPYFTTKGPQIGTGIGLFMSKSIIEKNMGGRLTVRNTDTGAEFKIEVGNGI